MNIYKRSLLNYSCASEIMFSNISYKLAVKNIDFQLVQNNFYLLKNYFWWKTRIAQSLSSEHSLETALIIFALHVDM